jgi:hypothetical protein
MRTIKFSTFGGGNLSTICGTEMKSSVGAQARVDALPECHIENLDSRKFCLAVEHDCSDLCNELVTTKDHLLSTQLRMNHEVHLAFCHYSPPIPKNGVVCAPSPICRRGSRT